MAGNTRHNRAAARSNGGGATTTTTFATTTTTAATTTTTSGVACKVDGGRHIGGRLIVGEAEVLGVILTGTENRVCQISLTGLRHIPHTRHRGSVTIPGRKGLLGGILLGLIPQFRFAGLGLWIFLLCASNL
jgi:hypothetical protein